MSHIITSVSAMALSVTLLLSGCGTHELPLKEQINECETEGTKTIKGIFPVNQFQKDELASTSHSVFQKCMEKAHWIKNTYEFEKYWTDHFMAKQGDRVNSDATFNAPLFDSQMAGVRRFYEKSGPTVPNEPAYWIKQGQ
jgi:hypothetical protein